MKAVRTKGAPDAVGPYSQAVVSGNLVFCAGQLGLDPETNKMVEGGIEAETKRALKNLEAILKAEKLNTQSVAMVNVYLKNMSDFAAMNKIYGKYFFSSPQPARVTVGVSELPKNALVEISCIAHKE